MEISLLFDLVLIVSSIYDLTWECSTSLCWFMPWLTVNEQLFHDCLEHLSSPFYASGEDNKMYLGKP